MVDFRGAISRTDSTHTHVEREREAFAYRCARRHTGRDRINLLNGPWLWERFCFQIDDIAFTFRRQLASYPSQMPVWYLKNVQLNTCCGQSKLQGICREIIWWFAELTVSIKMEKRDLILFGWLNMRSPKALKPAWVNPQIYFSLYISNVFIMHFSFLLWK